MSCIVYHRDPKSGSTYAYRSESYRDPATGKPRNRKEYLGRVDPETGEIVPKRPRPRRAGAPAATVPSDARVAALESQLADARAELADARAERDSLREALATLARGARSVSEGAIAALGGVGGHGEGETG